MNRYVQYMYSYPHKTAYRSLNGITLSLYAQYLAGGGHGLYVHIPFCQSKCGYCNLFSVTGQDRKAVDAYLDAVERQCGQYREVLRDVSPSFSQVVIGGGTPLYLSEEQLVRVFSLLQSFFCLEEGREVVIETAPNQTTAEKLNILKGAGVTRVSMGIQSFSDRELSALGRRHNAWQARMALELLRSFDFSCVNVDFIYGIPGQGPADLLASLEEAVSFVPDEIFLYPLYVKHGAGLELAGVVPDAQGAFACYQAGRDFLLEAGYRQDSMRRFVWSGSGSSERTFVECGFGSSLALGCGGRSYLGNLHFCSPYALPGRECLARLAEYEAVSDHTRITHGFLLSDGEQKRRYLIRHLLIRPGLDRQRYRAVFGTDVTADFSLLEDWEERGYVEQKGGYLTLSGEGLALSDYLGPQLISPDVERAMQEWEVSHGRADGFIQGSSQKL